MHISYNLVLTYAYFITNFWKIWLVKCKAHGTTGDYRTFSPYNHGTWLQTKDTTLILPYLRNVIYRTLWVYDENVCLTVFNLGIFYYA